MYARNVSVSELQEIAALVPCEISADTAGNRVRFTLRPMGDNFRKWNPSPMDLEWCAGSAIVSDWKFRRANAVCFHGHYKFLEMLFDRNPAAIVDSSRYGKVRYTADNFKSAADDYGDTPLGTGTNIYAGFKLRDCCYCEIH